MKSFFLFCLLCAAAFGYTGPVSGVYTTDGSVADVQAAVTAAVAGDTVLIPSNGATGYTWTSPLTINKAIHLKGETVITDAGTSTPSTNGNAGTIIFDGQTTDRTSGALILLTHEALTGIARISNLEFRGSVAATSQRFTGVIKVVGSNTSSTFGNSQWSISNVKFDGIYGRVMGIYAWSGLIHDCWINSLGYSMILFDGRRNSGVQQGHTSWAADSDAFMGTADEGVYVENTTAVSTGNNVLTDCFAGARIVIRHCYLQNASIENHGTESTRVYRGGRWIAAHDNTLHRSLGAGKAWLLFRSGHGVVYNNVTSGTNSGFITAASYRSTTNYTPYLGADGTNAWDYNDATLYASGTHTGATGTSLIVPGAGWTPGQWTGYTVKNTTDSTGTDIKFGLISGNTADTLTVHAPISPAPRPTWETGDAFEIRKVIYTLDQPGMGQSDLLVGGSDFVAPTPTTWPNQIVEPIYYWNNTGVADGFSPLVYQNIVSGTHFINDEHPTYTPYTYPHPLTLDLPPDATAPTITDVTVYEDTLTLTFDEPVVGVSASDFAMSGGRSLSAATGGGDNWNMTVSPAAAFGAAYTLDYSGTATEDSASNNLATFTGRSITNTTPEPPPTESVRNPGRRAKGGRVLTR